MKIRAKTLGQQLLDQARTEPGHVKLTDEYWGSVFGYSAGRYYIRSYVGGFGGMKRRDRIIRAGEISSINDRTELARILHPSCDIAPGDPMNYAPRNVQPVELTWCPVR